MATLTVGPGEEYSTLSAAVAASQDGDVIEVNAGTYTNDFPEEIDDSITIEGVGGLASFVATEPPPNEKGILVIGSGSDSPTVTLDDLELSGVAISDDEGGNGAGVRYQSGNLTINNSYIHDNQDGILADADASGSVTITNTEFADNGTSSGSSSGFTHNIYIGAVGTFDITDSYVTAANVGNEIQTRALVNIITDNRIVDGPTATASYSINLIDGGVDTVSGNTIEKGPNSGNPFIIAFGADGSVYAGSSLTVSDNTILYDGSRSDVSALHNFVSAPTLYFTDNSVYGLTSSQLTSGGPVVDSGTDYLTTEPTISDPPPYTTCFCAGTRIATQKGEVPIEHLSVGDLVLTSSGAMRPVIWIGIGHVLATPGRRNAATPVIVRRGALGDDIPRRDLRLTKGHSLYLDDVLIPVEYLVNHRSILWDDRAQAVTIYHVELETHDVLLAEGAPAETYRDDGNRWLFQVSNARWDLAAQPPCAPVLTGGPVVDAVWWRLLDRAGPRPPVATTGQSDLHLLVDGVQVEGRRRADHVYVFRLPPAPGEVRIVSRAGVPAELGLARDPRRLGVAVRRVMLWQGARLRVVEAADAALTDGFHPYETENGFRWTDGDARLPATVFGGFGGACELELHVGGAMRYPLADAVLRAVA